MLTGCFFQDGCRRRSVRGHDSYGQVWPDVSCWAEIRWSEGGSLERAKREYGDGRENAGKDWADGQSGDRIARLIMSIVRR